MPGPYDYVSNGLFQEQEPASQQQQCASPQQYSPQSWYSQQSQYVQQARCSSPQQTRCSQQSQGVHQARCCSQPQPQQNFNQNSAVGYPMSNCQHTFNIQQPLPCNNNQSFMPYNSQPCMHQVSYPGMEQNGHHSFHQNSYGHQSLQDGGCQNMRQKCMMNRAISPMSRSPSPMYRSQSPSPMCRSQSPCSPMSAAVRHHGLQQTSCMNSTGCQTWYR